MTHLGFGAKIQTVRAGGLLAQLPPLPWLDISSVLLDSELKVSARAGKNPSENRFSLGREPRSREKPQRESFLARPRAAEQGKTPARTVFGGRWPGGLPRDLGASGRRFRVLIV